MTEQSPDSEDETHRRFREALERKKRSAAARESGADATAAGLRVHASDKRQRQFRRKSGG